MKTKYFIKFRKFGANHETGVADSYQIASEALAYIDALSFFVGLINIDDLKEKDSEEVRCCFKGVSELITTFSNIASAHVHDLESFRKDTEESGAK